MATVIGTDGTDLINGTMQDDDIFGRQGNDLLDGRAGNDLVEGEDGNDIMWGRSGSDSLRGGEGDDVAFGGSGKDFFEGSWAAGPFGEGDDVAFGGSGNDSFDAVELHAGDDWMVGGSGDDVFDYTIDSILKLGEGEVPIGNDTIIGGPGIDRVEFSSPFPPVSASAEITGTAAVVVDLKNGNFSTAEVSGTIVGVERIIGSEHDDTILGSRRAESLSGSFGDDCIEGRGGDDSLGGDYGNDTLYGGSGNDTLLLSFDEEDDVAYGGAGDDFFAGVESEEGGDDWMDGGPGNDVFDYTITRLLFPGDGLVPIGNDTIIGGSGTDRVVFSDPSPHAPSGSYEIFRGLGTAAVAVDLKNGTFSTAEVSGTIVGVEGIMGSEGNDTILGSRRAESLSGSHGNDYIAGRGGNDRLDGGFGLNTLKGGAGGDEFVFNAINTFFESIEVGLNVIEDFTRRDELLFDNSWFEALGAEAKWGARDERFHAAAGATSGHDANDRLVYNRTTGDLYYDADGNGAEAALLVASLQCAPTLAASDITVI